MKKLLQSLALLLAMMMPVAAHAAYVQLADGVYQDGSTLYIGSSVTSLDALQVNPTEIYCYATIPPALFSNTFTGYDAALHVPAASMVSYFTTLYWYNFNNITGDAVEPQSVILSESSVELEQGGTVSLSATVTPSNATPGTVYWSSSNIEVATVNDGLVTAVAAGECDIVATCVDKQAVCHVTVTPQRVIVTLDQHTARLLPNHTMTLTATCTPPATNLAVTTSNPAVAIPRYINGTIMVVGIGEGTANITVSTDDGWCIPDACEVTVYTLLGDVNADGFVDVSDVTALIARVLGDEVPGFNEPNADVNHDDDIDVSDVTMLIAYILGNVDLNPPDEPEPETVITFIPGETVGYNEAPVGADEMSLDGITVSTTVGGLKAAQYRFAKGSVTTISSTIGNITKIEFSCEAEGTNKYGPGCFEGTDGYTYEGKIGTWTGNAASVQFTAVSNQVRANKIVVTVGGDGLGAPTIKPAGGTYYNPIEVTITCSTSGADIYYTVNGNDPTTSSTKYTAPFTLSANTTVKAISAKDGKTSDVVTAEYVFVALLPEDSVAFRELFDIATNASGIAVTIKNDAVVLAQQGRYLYLKDATETGYGMVYGTCGQTYQLGDVIPAGFGGPTKIYDMEPELYEPLTGFQPAKGNIGGREALEAAAEKITISQVGHETWGHYVRIDNVTINTSDKTFTDATGTIGYYDRFTIQWPEDLNKTYTIYAIVASYKTNYQLLPTRIVSEEENPGV